MHTCRMMVVCSASDLQRNCLSAVAMVTLVEKWQLPQALGKFHEFAGFQEYYLLNDLFSLYVEKIY